MEKQVPSYWKEHIDSRIEKINKIREVSEGNVAEFMFFTDSHIEVAENKTPELMSYIAQKTGINTIIFGGDFMDGRKDINVALTYVEKWREMWKDIPLYGVRGNHDINSAGDFTCENRLGDKGYEREVHSMYKNLNNGKDFYSYFDDEKNKIRYFLLDTGARYSDIFGAEHEKDYIIVGEKASAYKEQLDYLFAKSKELTSDWHIVVVQHIVIGGQNCLNPRPVYLMPQGKDLLVVLDKIQEDTTMPRVLAVLCGHNHVDREMLGMGGYPVMSTTCDSGTEAAKHSQLNPIREPGTTDEQAFDVVQIDLKNYRVHTTRIGKGEDRAYRTYLSVTQ